MRIVGFFVALALVAIGIWSYVAYGAVAGELKRNYGLGNDNRFGPFDDVEIKKQSIFFIEFGGNKSVDTPPDANASRPISTGVQTNPHLDPILIDAPSASANRFRESSAR